MSKEPRRPFGAEDVAEDVFGLNFRSLRTLRDLFLRPRRVFASYAAGDRG